MANLEGLPAEILFHTADHLTESKSDIVHLASVSRALNRTLTPLLYQSIDITLRGFDHTISRKCELLLRTLSEKPQLVHCIQHARLFAYNPAGRPEVENKRLNQLSNALLGQLCQLRNLELEAGGPGHFGYALTSSTIKVLSALRYARIKSPDMSFKDVCLFLNQTNIQKLKIENLAQYSIQEGLIDLNLSGTTCLSEIVLSEILLPSDVFKEVLSLPQSLRSLTLLLPSRNPRRHLRPMGARTMSLSPSALGRCLQPVSGSLVTLSIEEYLGGAWPSREKTRIDLADFTALQTLRTPSHFIFPRTGPSSPLRKGLHLLLPASLKELDITFGLDDALLHRSENAWKAFHLAGQNVDEGRYEWLTEIAIHKQHSTPKLANVAIRERCSKAPQSSQALQQSCFRWRLPDTLRECFDSKGIDLEIHMRRPSDWQRRVDEGHTEREVLERLLSEEDRDPL